MSDFFEKLSSNKEEINNENFGGQNELSSRETENSEEGQLAVDVFQTDSDLVIQSTIAGVKSEDLDISIQNDMVTIRGERKKELETNPQDYFHQECYWGPFSRQIILPEEIDPSKAKAELKNGILTLWLPKLEKTKTTKIRVTEVK